MRHTISNSDDVIDSRDVIKRIAELEDERDSLEESCREAVEALEAAGPDADRFGFEDARDKATEALREWEEDDDSGGELKRLKAFEDELSHDGQALVRDSYFEDYARQMAEDMGAIDPKASWPLNCIDWKEAAEQLQQDYTQIEYGDVTYWLGV